MNLEDNNHFSDRGQIQKLIMQLKGEVISFNVIERDGQTVGIVKDIYIVENEEVNLLISLTQSLTKSNLFLLNSRYIQKLDPNNKYIVVDLNKTDIKNLPLYNPRSENHSNSLTGSNLNSFQKKQSEIREKQRISLLEEQLKVNYTKRKVGEIRVRKKIETRLIEVPVKWEKLIVEQIGSEPKKLAEIVLGQGEVSGVEFNKLHLTDSNFDRARVSGEFLSVKAAKDLLEAIALQKQSGCAKVRIELILDEPDKQAMYQQMFDRCSARSSLSSS
jgi:hypothetical protein